METLCNVRAARTGCKENHQLWHKCVQYWLCGQNGTKVAVPVYSGILEQNYFFKSKKNLWHTWHTLFLAYYCWYKPIIVCHDPWHSLAQSNKSITTTTFLCCIRRARPFLFFQKLFCPKISLYSIRSI